MRQSTISAADQTSSFFRRKANANINPRLPR